MAIMESIGTEWLALDPIPRYSVIKYYWASRHSAESLIPFEEALGLLK